MCNISTKSIEIPATVTLIETYAFYRASIKFVYFKTFEQNVEIEQFAFIQCPQLHSIYIPQSGVIFSSPLVFYDCPRFRNVYYILKPLEFQHNLHNDTLKYHTVINSKIESNTNEDNVIHCGTVREIYLNQNMCKLSNPHTCNQPFTFSFSKLHFTSIFLFLGK